MNKKLLEDITKWLNGGYYYCIYCDQFCIVKDCIGKGGCFIHPKGLMQEYNYEIYECCKKKNTSKGCESVDHFPFERTEKFRYLPVQFYFIKEGIVQPNKDRIHKEIWVDYERKGNRENFSPNDINPFESFYIIKTF
jgi:hypothetical protein